MTPLSAFSSPRNIAKTLVYSNRMTPIIITDSMRVSWQLLACSRSMRRCLMSPATTYVFFDQIVPTLVCIRFWLMNLFSDLFRNLRWTRMLPRSTMNGSSKAESLSNAGSPFRRLILESFLNTKAFCIVSLILLTCMLSYTFTFTLGLMAGGILPSILHFAPKTPFEPFMDERRLQITHFLY